jgi:hypothetical protein
MSDRTEATPIESGPDWYKDAIIYELHVRSFNDSDADGVGDFKGLREKLDYLQDLGVTATISPTTCTSMKPTGLCGTSSNFSQKRTGAAFV